MKDDTSTLTIARLSLLIGTVLGQMSELLNGIQSTPMTNQMIYKSLLDIHNACGLLVHEIFYKNNTCEEKADEKSIAESKLLEIKLYNLDWDVSSPCVRTVNCLRSENIETVGDVATKSKCVLHKIPNFGRKSMRALEHELKKIGIALHEGKFSDTYDNVYPIKYINEVK